MSYSPFIKPRTSQFNEQLIVEDTQQINLKSIYGYTALRDIKTETGSATVTNNNIEYRLQTTASGPDAAILDSAERGRYVAGQDSVAGIGVRVSDTPTGNQFAQWGYYDDNDGFGFGVDATGTYVFYRNAGTDTKTYQSSWNADVLDGTGKSGYTFALADGHIFHINFSWYGFGAIEFSIFTNDSNNVQSETIVHRLRVTGGTSIQNPNLPLRVEVDNNGTADAFDSVYVGGRQFSTRGNYTPYTRTTGQERTSVGSITSSTYLPIVTFRRKTGAFEHTSVRPQGFDLDIDQSVYAELRVNGSLTGASYVTPIDYTATETAVETDISASAITGGEVVWKGLIRASGGGPSSGGGASVPIAEVDMVANQPLTLCLKAKSTTATASAVFRVVEEW